jgi:hypothetical protein
MRLPKINTLGRSARSDGYIWLVHYLSDASAPTVPSPSIRGRVSAFGGMHAVPAQSIGRAALPATGMMQPLLLQHVWCMLRSTVDVAMRAVLRAQRCSALAGRGVGASATDGEDSVVVGGAAGDEGVSEDGSDDGRVYYSPRSFSGSDGGSVGDQRGYRDTRGNDFRSDGDDDDDGAQSDGGGGGGDGGDVSQDDDGDVEGGSRIDAAVDDSQRRDGGVDETSWRSSMDTTRHVWRDGSGEHDGTASPPSPQRTGSRADESTTPRRASLASSPQWALDGSGRMVPLGYSPRPPQEAYAVTVAESAKLVAHAIQRRQQQLLPEIDRMIKSGVVHAWGRCAVLCCAVLCCAVLCCAVLCCAVLCCAVLCCDGCFGGVCDSQRVPTVPNCNEYGTACSLDCLLACVCFAAL